MSILQNKYKHENDREKRVFLGAQVPEESLSYLTMFSLAFQKTKSEIIRQAISAKIRALKIQFPEVLVEQELAKRLKTEWLLLDMKKEQNTSFIEFKEEVFKELRKAKIPATKINCILEQI